MHRRCIQFVPVRKNSSAVRFRQTPIDASLAFSAWHQKISPATATVFSLTPVFLPFWSFSARVKFSRSWLRGHPALQVYSGALIPRAVADLYLQDKPELASPYDTSLRHSAPNVIVEPFALFEKSAWQLAQARYGQNGKVYAVEVDFKEVSSRRILYPAYVLKYRVLGLQMTAYIQGVTGAVWGTAQEAPGAQLYTYYKSGFPQGTTSVGATVGVLLELLSRLNPHMAKALYVAAAAILQASARLLFFPPFFLSLCGLLGHTVVQPIYVQWKMEAAWAQQKEKEQATQRGERDEWVYREAESSSSSSSSGTQRTQNSSSSTSKSMKKKPPFVAPGDHHGILRVLPSASKEELAEAFRRELHKFHPDHAEAGGWDLQASSDRTREIIEAYKVLRRGLPKNTSSK